MNPVQQSFLNRMSTLSQKLADAKAAADDLSNYSAQYNAANHKALADQISTQCAASRIQVDALSANDAEIASAGA